MYINYYAIIMPELAEVRKPAPTSQARVFISARPWFARLSLPPAIAMNMSWLFLKLFYSLLCMTVGREVDLLYG